MNIVDRYNQSRLIITGRLSDGSDRQEIIITDYVAKVEADDRFYLLTFDHEPTDAEILTAFEEGQGEEVTSIEDLAGKLSDTKQRLMAAEDAILAIMGI